MFLLLLTSFIYSSHYSRLSQSVIQKQSHLFWKGKSTLDKLLRTVGINNVEWVCGCVCAARRNCIQLFWCEIIKRLQISTSSPSGRFCVFSDFRLRLNLPQFPHNSLCGAPHAHSERWCTAGVNRRLLRKLSLSDLNQLRIQMYDDNYIGGVVGERVKSILP